MRVAVMGFGSVWRHRLGKGDAHTRPSRPVYYNHRSSCAWQPATETADLWICAIRYDRRLRPQPPFENDRTRAHYLMATYLSPLSSPLEFLSLVAIAALLWVSAWWRQGKLLPPIAVSGVVLIPVLSYWMLRAGIIAPVASWLVIQVSASLAGFLTTVAVWVKRSKTGRITLSASRRSRMRSRLL